VWQHGYLRMGHVSGAHGHGYGYGGRRKITEQRILVHVKHSFSNVTVRAMGCRLEERYINADAGYSAGLAGWSAVCVLLPRGLGGLNMGTSPAGSNVTAARRICIRA